MRAWQDTVARAQDRSASFEAMVPVGPACACGNGKIDTCQETDRGGCAGVDHPCDPGPERMRTVTEVCDGSDLGGRTCQSLGFQSGTLRCAQCKLVTTSCVPFSPGGKSVAINGTIIANDDVVAVITTDAANSVAKIARFDHELHALGEISLPGGYLYGAAPSESGFFVSTVVDDGLHLRQGAIFEIPNRGGTATRAFSFADGLVASMFTVRTTDGRLRDPLAMLVSPKGDWWALRVRAGNQPLRSSYVETESTGAATELPSGVVLPAKRFQAAFSRVHPDGSVDRLALPIACPVQARLSGGWLAFTDATMVTKLVAVDGDLHFRSEPVVVVGNRPAAPVFAGDVLWLGEDDFVRTNAPSTIVHVLHPPNAPSTVIRFGTNLAMTTTQGLTVIAAP